MRRASGPLRVLAATSALLGVAAGLSACGTGGAARPEGSAPSGRRTEPEIAPFSDIGGDAALATRPTSSWPRGDESATEAGASGSVPPLFVVFGQTLIVPTSRLVSDGRLPKTAKLDDGRDVPLVVHRVVTRSPISGLPTPMETAALRWLGGAVAWAEVPAGEASMELCEVRLPVDAYGHWLWIGDQRVSLEWLSEDNTDWSRVSPAIAKQAGDPFIRECLRLESRDPRLAWRASLFGLSARVPTPPSLPIPFERTPELIETPDDGAFLDRAADQTASLWRHTLAALHRADKGVAQRVVDRLGAIVSFEAGGRQRLAPAWASASEAGALLEALLERRREPRRMVAAANEWLRSRPAACAWITDDAGLYDSNTNVPLVRVGVANFGEGASVASVKGVIDAGGPELGTLAARSATVLPVAPLTTPDPGDGVLESQGIDVRCGDWAGVIEAQRRHLVAQPPGLSIGPLSLDHSISTWSRSQTVVPLPGDGATRRDIPTLVGRLVRDVGPGGSGVGSGWSLYLEAERSTSERQTVRLWFGPAGSPSAVVTADLPENSSIPESGEGSATVRLAGRADSALVGARVVPNVDRWTVRLPIPNSAIERPGRVRLAIEHVRGNVRSAWPRAMFPWQTEPGRASVDLTKW
ncbi:MAG: hypothetical protein K2Y21_10640 [Phycisphaerales bacterium]|nr:hypothetical protein [Phycisphaerales bacterium]